MSGKFARRHTLEQADRCSRLNNNDADSEEIVTPILQLLESGDSQNMSSRELKLMNCFSAEPRDASRRERRATEKSLFVERNGPGGPLNQSVTSSGLLQPPTITTDRTNCLTSKAVVWHSLLTAGNGATCALFPADRTNQARSIPTLSLAGRVVSLMVHPASC